MVEFRTLEDESVAAIHRAFVDAFSEYEVPLEMPVPKLTEMLETRSYQGGSSVGCYVGGALVGFTLVGIRDDRGVRRAYDIATGIDRSHQRQGLAPRLFDRVRELLVRGNTESFTLEVLENNLAAQGVYRKLGFQVTRKLRCFERDHPGRDPVAGGDHRGDLPLPDDEELFCSFAPSWQNSLASYCEMPHRHRVVTVADEAGGIRGYAVVHGESGAILQIGSADGEDREAVVGQVLNLVERTVQATKLRYLNVEEGSWMSATLARLGFRNFINQEEMRLKLTPGVADQ